MEVACTAFSNHRVKIKDLNTLSLEFYMSVRKYYMSNMAGLVARVRISSLILLPSLSTMPHPWLFLTIRDKNTPPKFSPISQRINLILAQHF